MSSDPGKPVAANDQPAPAHPDPILDLIRIAPMLPANSLKHYIVRFVRGCARGCLTPLKAYVQHYDNANDPHAARLWTRHIRPILLKAIDNRLTGLAAQATQKKTKPEESRNDHGVAVTTSARPHIERHTQLERLAQLEASTEHSVWRDAIISGLKLTRPMIEQEAEEDFPLARLLIDRRTGTLWLTRDDQHVLIEQHSFELRSTRLRFANGNAEDLPFRRLHGLKALAGRLSEEQRAKLKAQIERVTVSKISERWRRLVKAGIVTAEQAVKAGYLTAEAAGLAFDAERPMRLAWRLLPKPPSEPAQFRGYLQEHFGTGYTSDLDLERLTFINGLGPSRAAVGLDELEGYIAFLFDETALAVLDCPKIGNAIYLLEENWEALSRLTKRELRSAGVKRLMHKGDWRKRLSDVIWSRRRAQGKS